MPTKEHVRLDGKLFIVPFDEDQPKVNKQRKAYAPGKPWLSLYDAPYWHQCKYCLATNREIMVINDINYCPSALEPS